MARNEMLQQSSMYGLTWYIAQRSPKPFTPIHRSFLSSEILGYVRTQIVSQDIDVLYNPVENNAIWDDPKSLQEKCIKLDLKQMINTLR